jgi:ABC-type sugar transport system substrate-binding protein
MKRFVVPLMAVAVVVAIILAGCAGPAPTTPTTPTTPTVPTTPTTPTTPTEPTTPTTPTEPTPGTDPAPPPTNLPIPPNPIAGVGLKPDGVPYVFAYNTLFIRNPWTATDSGLVVNFFERSGAVCNLYDANLDVQRQIGIMEDLIAQGVDAIIVHAVDSAAIAPFYDEAAAAGIPCFSVDFIVPSDHEVSCATHDQVAMGRARGEELVRIAEETNTPITVYELHGILGSEGENRRHEGLVEGIDNNPLITHLESPGTDWQDDVAFNALMDTLPAHPEINAISANGQLVSGMKEALNALGMLKNRGEPGHIICQTDDEGELAVQAIKDGWFDDCTAHSPAEEVDACVMNVLTYVCVGQSVPQLVLFNSQLFNVDNLDQPRFGAPALWGNMGEYQRQWQYWPFLDIPAEYGVITPTVDMKPAGK